VEAMENSSYAYSAWALSRGIALCFVIAFASLLPQMMGLYGKNGILSIHQFMRVIKNKTGPQRYYELPTLFWLNSSDLFLNAVAGTGLLAALLATLGFSTPVMMVVTWACYLSFVNSGQDFLRFQWDILLLETGFLSFFLSPWRIDWSSWAVHEPSVFVRWLFWILLFKLIFLSGVVKVISKDPVWRNLTALKYHYWTQPIPNPISYFMAKLPEWFQKICTGIMFTIELAVPFLIFLPGKARWVGAGLIFTFQVLILITGNYAFFNFLSAILCFILVDDTLWQPWLMNFFPKLTLVTEYSMIYNSAGAVLAVIILPLNLFWFALAFWDESPLLNSFLAIIRTIYNLRINSSYGLFAVMTKQRPELVLQGSNDTENWEDYEFKFKPSSLKTMPPVLAPHQPRLDWQMWFAALGTFRQNLWLQNLMARIFMNSEDVLNLLRKNPFPEVPKYLRLVRYQYKFSETRDLFKQGIWWQREYVGLYSPVFEKTDFVEES
jgi:hypothetical protein